MLLLALDTSGRNGSLALVRVGGAGLDVVTEVALAGNTFSAQLVPRTSALLKEHGFSKADLAGFAVVSGPGSFTGLRVGLAAVKGMGEVLRKPIGAVSLLEALARSARSEGRVFSILDAGRGEFYVGDYEVGSLVRMHSERLLGREEFLIESKSQPVITSDERVADAIRGAEFDIQLVGHPRISDIALLGWERIQRGETVSPEQLGANYVRRSDAELFTKPKP
jgi:tRNA threonylcarbamoyladenosine biosynthesis protein TsaB